MGGCVGTEKNTKENGQATHKTESQINTKPSASTKPTN
jgi:hypothetical protein